MSIRLNFPRISERKKSRGFHRGVSDPTGNNLFEASTYTRSVSYCRRGERQKPTDVVPHDFCFLCFSSSFLLLCLKMCEAIGQEVDVRLCSLPCVLGLEHQVRRRARRHGACRWPLRSHPLSINRRTEVHILLDSTAAWAPPPISNQHNERLELLRLESRLP